MPVQNDRDGILQQQTVYPTKEVLDSGSDETYPKNKYIL